MKKYGYLFILCILTAAFALTGCKSRAGSGSDKKDGVVDKATVDTTYKVYYLNKDNTRIEGVSKIYTAETPEVLVTECLGSLQTAPENENLKMTIPDGVQVLESKYDSGNKQADIYFNEAYSAIPKNEEILVRAAVVKTLTQFDKVIDYVQFFVGGEPLPDSDGKTMIMMNSDFVEDTKADVKHLNQSLIKLYFASTDGTQLAFEDVNVHYLKTTSLEKVIVESLISGPISRNLNPTLSSDVKINNDVNVVDGICYVDFNQRFLDRINDQNFVLNVYSVVNSLTELTYIEKVQITIDGNTVTGPDANISLAVPLVRNEDIIVKPVDTPPVLENGESISAAESEAQSETGTPPDTGTPSESGTPPDTGTQPEAGAPETGTTSESGTSSDTGTASESGT